MPTTHTLAGGLLDNTLTGGSANEAIYGNEGDDLL
jgi:Ca2+-binding RTX toxin-like protein